MCPKVCFKGSSLISRLPLSHSAPPLTRSLFPLEFHGEVNHEETIESLGYSVVKVA